MSDWLDKKNNDEVVTQSSCVIALQTRVQSRRGTTYGSCHTYFPQSTHADPRIFPAPAGDGQSLPKHQSLMFTGRASTMHNIISFPATASDCANCRWSRRCITRHLDSAARAEFSRHVTRGGPFKHGEQLFRQGDKLNSLYVIRAGSVKTYFDSADGCEQTVGFQYPGDILGFDAIAEGCHPTSAIALETVAYCDLSYEAALSLAGKLPGLGHEMMRAAAHQMILSQNHVLIVAQKSAPARLASFLVDLSQRFAARGCSKTEFNLSMSRQEIANYLAVAIETISRLFTDLQRRGVISVERRLVKIRSLTALETLASDLTSLKVSNV